MSRIKIAGLALASMLVMGMALAGNALAVLLWLVCLEGEGLTKYENSKCLTSKATQTRGEKGWQSVGLATGQTATVKILVLSIKLEDTKAAIATSVKCLNKGSRGEGIIEAGGKGSIRAASYSKPEENCVGTGGCKEKEVEVVEGVHLPWTTELFEGTEKLPLTKITAHAGGEPPGWLVRCENILDEKEPDECIEEAASGKEEVKLTFGEVTENPEKVKELLVRGLFQENHRAHCSVGGAGAGRVLGTLAILLPGGALSINKF
jgi:hypothetical protein